MLFVNIITKKLLKSQTAEATGGFSLGIFSASMPDNMSAGRYIDFSLPRFEASYKTDRHQHEQAWQYLKNDLSLYDGLTGFQEG